MGLFDWFRKDKKAVTPEPKIEVKVEVKAEAKPKTTAKSGNIGSAKKTETKPVAKKATPKKK